MLLNENCVPDREYRAAGYAQSMSGEAGDRTDRSPGRAARMADRLDERRARHRRRSKLYRAGLTFAGFLIVLAGVALSAPGVPGPGFVVLAIGLAILALEFDWAERLLRRALDYIDRAAERAAGVSTRRKVVVAILSAAAGAAAIAAIVVFDIPIPPF